jgi:NADH:ubiquinone oxidoreductase subunit D
MTRSKIAQILIDESTIVSHLQYEELLETNVELDIDSQFSPLLNNTKLEPFFDDTVENLGLKLLTAGNRIVKAQVLRGYFFFDLEERMAQSSIKDAVISLSKMNIHIPIFYQAALIAALDNAFLEEKKNKKHLGIAMEWARIYHHMTVLRNVLYCLNLPYLANEANNILAIMAKPIIELCRVYVEDPTLEYGLSYLFELHYEIDLLFGKFESSFFNEKKIQKKLHNRWKISQYQAGSFGLSGLFLRANRYGVDARQQNSFLYEDFPKTCYGEGGDAWTRYYLRVLEINSSLAWIKQYTKKDLVSEPVILTNDNYNLSKKKTFGSAEIEGPEGIIKVSIFSDEKNKCLVYRIRSPAYFIAQVIPIFLQNIKIKDLALFLSSLGINGREVDF